MPTDLPDDLPEPRDVLRAHEQIEETYDLTYTGAAVAAPRLKIERLLREDVAPRDPPYERAAALLRKLITEHYFEDGNKRTAWTVTRSYLKRKGTQPAQRGPIVERVLKRIRRYSIPEIAEWLETGQLDRDRLDP